MYKVAPIFVALSKTESYPAENKKFNIDYNIDINKTSDKNNTFGLKA